MILEVDNNVTYVTNNGKIVGKKSHYPGQLSLREYEAIAGVSTAGKSLLNDNSSFNSPQSGTGDILSFSGREFAPKITLIKESEEKDEIIRTDRARIS